jgi:AraC family transcriptional regulator, arabinose operon regulatory protein
MVEMLDSLYVLIMTFFSGINLEHFGHIERCAVFMRTRFPNFHALNFAWKGVITLKIDDQKPVTLHAPVAWLTRPGPHYEYGPLERETWDHYYVTFSGPRLKKYGAGGLMQDKDYTSIPEAALFRRYFDDLIHCLAERQMDRAVNLLEGLLIRYAESTPAAERSDTPEIITSLGRDIQLNPTDSWDFHKLARESGVSYVHFRRLFKAHYHLAPHRFVLEHRLAMAANLLRTHGCRVKIAAETAGFDDVFYFTKMFRKKYGIPPASYRTQGSRLNTQ